MNLKLCLLLLGLLSQTALSADFRTAGAADQQIILVDHDSIDSAHKNIVMYTAIFAIDYELMYSGLQITDIKRQYAAVCENNPKILALNESYFNSKQKEKNIQLLKSATLFNLEKGIYPDDFLAPKKYSPEWIAANYACSTVAHTPYEPPNDLPASATNLSCSFWLNSENPLIFKVSFDEQSKRLTYIKGFLASNAKISDKTLEFEMAQTGTPVVVRIDRYTGKSILVINDLAIDGACNTLTKKF